MALREALNKALSENKQIPLPDFLPGEEKKEKEALPGSPEPISLGELKTPESRNDFGQKDKSASAEEMDKLKNLVDLKADLEAKLPSKLPSSSPSSLVVKSLPEENKEEQKEEKTEKKEVPEDVLRKILE